MEGSNTRTFPRMLLDKPVELQINGDTIRVENPTNNLSVGGLFRAAPVSPWARLCGYGSRRRSPSRLKAESSIAAMAKPAPASGSTPFRAETGKR